MGEKTKNRLKRGERSNAYLTHAYRLPQSVESLGRINENQKLLANTGFHQL